MVWIQAGVKNWGQLFNWSQVGIDISLCPLLSGHLASCITSMHLSLQKRIIQFCFYFEFIRKLRLRVVSLLIHYVQLIWDWTEIPTCVLEFKACVLEAPCWWPGLALDASQAPFFHNALDSRWLYTRLVPSFSSVTHSPPQEELCLHGDKWAALDSLPGARPPGLRAATSPLQCQLHHWPHAPRSTYPLNQVGRAEARGLHKQAPIDELSREPASLQLSDAPSTWIIMPRTFRSPDSQQLEVKLPHLMEENMLILLISPWSETQGTRCWLMDLRLSASQSRRADGKDKHIKNLWLIIRKLILFYAGYDNQVKNHVIGIEVEVPPWAWPAASWTVPWLSCGLGSSEGPEPMDREKQSFYSPLDNPTARPGKVWWGWGAPRALRGWPSRHRRTANAAHLLFSSVVNCSDTASQSSPRSRRLITTNIANTQKYFFLVNM